MIDDLCIDTSYRNPVVLQRCHGQGGNQRWSFDKKVAFIIATCFILCFNHILFHNNSTLDWLSEGQPLEIATSVFMVHIRFLLPNKHS